MSFTSPVCLMAHATSTKSWLWHQHLSHLNFDTINELAKNDLVTSIPKFKYTKEHLCPSYEQGKSKRAHHKPKHVPNLKQRSKDEAPEEIKTFLKKIQVLLQASVIIVRTNNGTEFKNQNSSLIHQRFDKTPYKIINDRKPDISFLHVFEALCYPKNDCEDIGKLGAKGDIGFFIGYSATSCAHRVYNRRTRKIMETMNVTFDELSAMAFEQRSLKPELQGMTSRQISSGLDLTYAQSTITSRKPTERELNLLFKAMYDDYIGGQPSDAPRTTPAASATQNLHTPNASTTTADSAPTPTNSSSQDLTIQNTSQDVDELQPQPQNVQQQDNQPQLQYDKFRLPVLKTRKHKSILNFYAMTDLGTCVNIMPNSVFEYLKLTNLKKTDILVGMTNMTQQAPLGTVENVLVKIAKFVFPCDFVVIDMPGILGEMMIMGKLFLATIHAQIDVFNGEISFGIGEDRVKFDVKKLPPL
ncbi:retrovirus-related pol polyprotein from transposon TNT 1-94 [Tanacetum coccineum]|uniref:Retrovirus-related pol polyprotein from transposon TNT 1-94 n=1 Tax=Tanacetum coccineum TaxID=301880 RepID=A0ABQ5HXS3_9ASTR